MILNRLETLLMNNPVRAGIQRHLEVRRLLRLGGTQRGRRVLEVGCGRGVGVQLVLDHFGADRVDAFDLDPRMVDRARRRLASRGDRVRLWIGSATHIPAADGTYDAVFDFGILHHVPVWQDAVAEILRVLRPGGRFYAEEMYERFILHPLWGPWFDHPRTNRFDSDRFAQGLRDAGFHVRAVDPWFGLFGWVVADKP